MEGLSGMTTANGLVDAGEAWTLPGVTPEGNMQGRDYQIECCERIIDAIAAGNKAILCWLFTGAGKTVIFGLLARMLFNSKILIIAPQRELVWQAANTIDRVTGEQAEIEMADIWAQSYGNVTVASKQTLSRGRHKRFLGYRVIMVDEAHGQISPSMQAMLREFQEHGGHVIGFTATPFRHDGKRLMDFYDVLAYEMPADKGIDLGWCTPVKGKIVRCQYLDIKDVRVTGGDFRPTDLDLILGASRPLHQMCLTVQKERRGPAIAFLPGVRSAKSLSDMARNVYGINADFVCGDQYLQSEDDRNRILNKFRAGKIDLLCNCQVATTGFDAPITQTIFMFRPTRSRTLAMQIWGRAMRPLPGIVDGIDTADERKAAIAGSEKSSCYVIDITDSLADHSIVTAVDMFAKDDTPADVIRAARKRAEEGDPQDTGDLLAQAADDVRKAKLLEEGLALLNGTAKGQLHGQDVCLGSQKKCISQYKVPLRGRYAGKVMGDLDDGFIAWALRTPKIKGWQRGIFLKEQKRRSAARDAG